MGANGQLSQSLSEILRLPIAIHPNEMSELAFQTAEEFLLQSSSIKNGITPIFNCLMKSENSWSF